MSILILVPILGCGDDVAGTDASGVDAIGSDTTGADGSEADAGASVPRLHRPAATACPTSRGAGDFDPKFPPGACNADEDCSTGDNGRCLISRGGAAQNNCSYDECAMDSGCADGSVCDCRTDETSSAPNRCLVGECVVDADCGAGGFCSPSVGFEQVNLPYVGYFCHRAGDTCVNDEDCPSNSEVCAYDPSVMHWACTATGFFPP